jgi:hypothetical protein
LKFYGVTKEALAVWEEKAGISDKLMEFVELQRLLQDAKADYIIEVMRLVTLVRDVSKVLVDLGMPPILEIPWDLHMTGDILEVVDVILKRLQEAYASSHAPWD